MPSPVGHALGGLAAGFLGTRDRRWGVPLACAALAALPDIDLILPITHRGPTHSITAGIVTSAVAFAVLTTMKWKPRLRTAVTLGVAVLTHVLFDWLAADSAAPRGVMAFWPVSRAFYVSDVDLFAAVERRYWRDDFLRTNGIALARELAVLVPIVWLARTWVRRSAGP